MAKSKGVINNTAKVVAEARKVGIPVIFIGLVHRKDKVDLFTPITDLRLRGLMEPHVVDKETTEEVWRTLETLWDTNLDNATFTEKQDLIAKLGIKVYPSEDGKVVRVASKLQPFISTSKASPQIISIASPKL